MPRPGITITSSAAAVAGTPGEPLGTWIVAAETQRGPLVPDPTKPLRSIADYTATYGTRDATLGSIATTYDALDAYWRSGGAGVLLSRVVGPSAVVAFKVLQDRAGSPINTLKVWARGPGAWANTHLKVAVANGVTSNTYILTILVDDVATETSPELASPTDAVTWSATSRYVTITDMASATVAPTNNPAVLAAAALATGADDLSAVTDTDWTAALNAVPASYGPGLVSKVGVTTAAGHAGTVAHAAANNRFALLDGVAGSSQATLTTLAGTVQSTAGTSSEWGAVFAPWLTIPAANTGTSPRLVAPSAVAAGLISRQVTGGAANVAAAGKNGQALFVLDVQAVFSATELDTLNGASPVNVFLRPYPASSSPAVELYGYNTLASIASGSTNSQWRQATAQLLRAQLTHELRSIAEEFIFDQIDGRGLKIAEFNAALRGALQVHYDSGELYGATPADAYAVDTASVNTPTTIAAGQLNARVNVRVSPYAEFVTIDIAKFPVSSPLPA